MRHCKQYCDKPAWGITLTFNHFYVNVLHLYSAICIASEALLVNHLYSAPSQGRLRQCRLGFEHDTLRLLPLPTYAGTQPIRPTCTPIFMPFSLLDYMSTQLVSMIWFFFCLNYILFIPGRCLFLVYICIEIRKKNRINIIHTLIILKSYKVMPAKNDKSRFVY